MSFTPKQANVAVKLYLHYGIPLDKLPYTGSFEQMLADFAIETLKTPTLREFYLDLMSLRKAGKLGRLQSNLNSHLLQAKNRKSNV